MGSILFFLATIVKLSWTAPTTGPAPDGYKIVYGNTTTTKTTVVDVGNKTSHQLDLDLTTVKHISVKPYNQWGDGPEVPDVVVGKPLAVTGLTAMP